MQEHASRLASVEAPDPAIFGNASAKQMSVVRRLQTDTRLPCTLLANLSEFIANVGTYAERWSGLVLLYTTVESLRPDVQSSDASVLPKWITDNVVNEVRENVDDVSEIWLDFTLGVHLAESHRPIITIITTTNGNDSAQYSQLVSLGYVQDNYNDYYNEPMTVYKSADKLGYSNGTVRFPYEAVRKRTDCPRSEVSLDQSHFESLQYTRLRIRGPLLLTTILLNLTVDATTADSSDITTEHASEPTKTDRYERPIYRFFEPTYEIILTLTEQLTKDSRCDVATITTVQAPISDLHPMGGRSLSLIEPARSVEKRHKHKSHKPTDPARNHRVSELHSDGLGSSRRSKLRTGW
jgi:hypothetical protein